MSMPWDAPEAPLVPWAQPGPPAVADVAEKLRRLQEDVGTIVTHTGVMVHATGPHAAALSMLVNTRRGQLMPTGVARYTDGTTIQFQDIGMPQPGAPFMTLPELFQQLYGIVQQLGLQQ
jgi:hypothetical protein